MQRNNIWAIQTYPLADFKDQFLALSPPAQDAILSLLEQLAPMVDPEDHNASMDCPGIKGFNHAVKYVLNNSIVLIIALDRIDMGTHVDHTIVLFSCSG